MTKDGKNNIAWDLIVNGSFDESKYGPTHPTRIEILKEPHHFKEATGSKRSPRLNQQRTMKSASLRPDEDK